LPDGQLERNLLLRRLALLVAASVLLGCPGNHRAEDESKNAPPQNTTTTDNPQAVPERSATMNPIIPSPRELPSNRIRAIATQPIEVQLTEYVIQIPDSVPAGRQTFHIANAGKLTHNFAIEGNGVAQKLASDLPRGDAVELTADLKPGTYVVYCPVDKHRGRGMERTITAR
jgi:hypothetical protein